jgi:hypothetical protein
MGGWLGRCDRRRRARRPFESGDHHQPTYLVERDAPAGPPLDPNVRWFRRAVERVTGRSYDAYPDHDAPYAIDVLDYGPAVPVTPLRDRLPKPRKHPVSLFVKSNGRMREVKLRGLPLEMALDKLNRRIVAGWVMDEIAGTLAQLEGEEEEP